MKVKFNGTEGYLAELERDRPKLIRLTTCMALSRDGNVNTKRVSVVATHLSSDRQLVRLERYAGDMWALDVDDRTNKILNLADKIKKEINDAAKALKIEVRAGVIEP